MWEAITTLSGRASLLRGDNMLQTIEVSRLQNHPLNEFFFDDMSGTKWDEFLESVRTSGVIEPPVVTPNMIIVSGHQRIRACRELHIDRIDCFVREYDDEDAIVKDLIESNVRQRGNIPSSTEKMARIINKLYEIYDISRGGCRTRCELPLLESPNAKKSNDGSNCAMRSLIPKEPEIKSAKDIADMLGISTTTLNEFRSLNKVIPEFMQQLEEGKVTMSTAARVISRLTPDEQIQLFETLPEAATYTQKQMQEYVARIKKLEEEVETQRAENAGRLCDWEEKEREYQAMISDAEAQSSEMRDEVDRIRSQLHDAHTMRNVQVVETIPKDYFDLKRQVSELESKLGSLSYEETTVSSVKQTLNEFLQNIDVYQYLDGIVSKFKKEDIMQVIGQIESVCRILDSLRADLEIELEGRE